MAVIFISPKQRQKTLFITITVAFLLFMIFIFFGVFFAGPAQVASTLVFNKPKVNIDITIFDTDQFKNLQPFTQMQTEYSYKATAKNNKVQTGFISADSIDQARLLLTSSGLTVSEIKEAEIGRDNPFTPYYQTVITTSTTTTKTTKK